MNTLMRLCLALLCAGICISGVSAQEAPSETDAGNAENDNSIVDTGLDSREGEVNEEDLIIRDEESPEVQLEGGLNNFSIWDFLRMFIVLGGVIAVIYGLFYLLKKMQNPRLQENSLISLISSQSLQGNRSLHLIEVGNEVFLVGSSEGGVELVGKITDQETLDQVRLYRSEIRGAENSFGRTLRDIFGRNGGSNGEEEKDFSGALFLQKQRERLKNL